MTVIEKFLHEHFASLDDAEARSVPSSGAVPPVLPDSQPEVLDQTFAKVNTVAANSPAEIAGLKPGDEIRNFGYVNHSNHDSLKKVGECVQGNEGVSADRYPENDTLLLTKDQSNIFIRVSRPTGVAQHQELRLTLTPKRDWGGRGLLGCHVLPI